MFSNHPAIDKAMQHANRLGLSLDEALLLQSAHTEILVAAAAGTIDLQQMAREELASRGLEQEGRWVGFPKAAAGITTR
jgi:hypothetical protein